MANKKSPSKTTAKKTPAKKTTKTVASKPASKKQLPKKDEEQIPGMKTAPNKKTEADVQTTGHEWDGIREYNNPLPLWWLKIFIISIIFAVGYCIYFPSWPTMNGFLEGIGGWSQYSNLENQMEAGNAVRAPYEERIATMTPEEVKQEPDLYAYALESGRASYALYCSQCHGSSGGGLPGYPSHLDDEWIWGGSLEDIMYTLHHGIRSPENDETRNMGDMPAFGEILEKEEIRQVAAYVRKLSNDHLPETDLSMAGKVVFADNCATCHMEDGSGSEELGAPALNDAVWLYGNDSRILTETITKGRAGMMPSFKNILREADIKKLALYIQSLSGGAEMIDAEEHH